MNSLVETLESMLKDKKEETVSFTGDREKFLEAISGSNTKVIEIKMISGGTWQDENGKEFAQGSFTVKYGRSENG